MAPIALPPPLPASRSELLAPDPAREAVWTAVLRTAPELRAQFIHWVANELETIRAEQPARALELAEICLHLAALSGTPLETGLAQRGRAWALHNLNRFEEALRAYEAAEACFDQANDPVQRARTSIGKVWLLRYLGRYQEALETAAAARPVLVAAQRFRDTGVLDLNTAPVYRRLGMTRRALEINQQAAATFARIGEEDLEASALMNAANALTDLDEIAPAFEAYQRAAATYERLQRHQRSATLYTNLGELHQKAGRLDEALHALSKAAAIARDHALEREEAFAHAGLARAYGSLNLLREALEHNRRAAAYFRATGMVMEDALADADAAEYQLRLGRRREAHQLASDAAAKFGALGNVLHRATAELTLAAALAAEGPDAAAEALSRCRRARRILHQAGWLSGEGRAHQIEGELLERAGRPHAARRAYRTAAAIAGRAGILPLSFTANFRLGRTFHHSRPRTALEHYHQAAAYLETARKVLPDMELRQTFLADKASLFEHIVQLHLRDRAPHAVARAFEAVERSKSRALLDAVSGPAEGAPAERGRAVAPEAVDLHQRLAWFYNKLEQAETALAEAAQAREEVRRLEQELLASERQQRALQRPGVAGTEEVVSAAAVRRALAPQDILLEYYVAGDEILCFEVTAQTVQVHRSLGSSRRVQGLAEQLRFLMNAYPLAASLADESRAAFEETQHAVLRVLYDMLLGPLPARWQDGRLTVIPHGGLHTVPFSALWDGGRYVADHGPVLMAPSASVLTNLRQRARGRLDRPLVVAPDNTDLPAVAEEVRGLAQRFPSAIILRGDAATVEQFRRNSPGSDVLHLAMHASFRDDNPSFSGLKFADRWLLLREVARSNLTCWLAVLSACDTGHQQVNPGDELVGLSQAFFQAGCRSLVASLWPVADAIVPRFMDRFYQDVQAGQDVDAAVRQAQLAVREHYPNPFYWAPFTACGQR